MPSGEPRVETINELMIWINGQFGLVRQAQQSSAEDLKQVRTRIHDVSNSVAALTALNIQGKLDTFGEDLNKHDTAIEQLIKDSIARSTQMASVKAIYGLSGGAIVAVLTLILKLAGVFH